MSCLVYRRGGLQRVASWCLVDICIQTTALTLIALAQVKGTVVLWLLSHPWLAIAVSSLTYFDCLQSYSWQLEGTWCWCLLQWRTQTGHSSKAYLNVKTGPFPRKVSKPKPDQLLPMSSQALKETPRSSHASTPIKSTRKCFSSSFDFAG